MGGQVERELIESRPGSSPASKGPASHGIDAAAFSRPETLVAPLIQRKCSTCTDERGRGTGATLESAVLRLQSTIGNQGVRRLLAESRHGGALLSAQTTSPPSLARLPVGSPTDPLEREADLVAERVVSGSGAPTVGGGAAPHLARKCENCEEDERKKLRAKPAGATLPPSAPSSVISAAMGSGRPLEAGARSFMESRFAHEFGQVRIHDGPAADTAARSVHARAFTVGHDIVFRAGAYAPSSVEGARLLAHELTHTIQQEQGRGADRLMRQELGPVEGLSRVPPEGLMRIPPDLFKPEVTFEPPQIDFTELPELPELPEVPPDIAPDPAPTPDVKPAPEVGPRFGPQPGPFPGPMPQPQPQPKDPDQDKDPDCGPKGLPPTMVTFAPGPLGQGGRVTAQPLTKCAGNTRGSFPSPLIYGKQFECIAKAGETFNWVRAHVLHGETALSGPRNLHGPGSEMRNLIIADKSLNGEMRRRAEGPALDLVYDHKRVLWYDSVVDSYVPGFDFFAESVTVGFGLFDPATGVRGARLGGGTFTRKRTPPNCPASLGSPAVTTPFHLPRSSGPAGTALFQSTLSICLNELASRLFHLSDGGLEVRLDTRWQDASGRISSGASCPDPDIEVALERDAWWGCCAELNSTKVSSGGVTTLRWRRLPEDDYRLVFKKKRSPGNSAAGCVCLVGDVVIGKFHAPRPTGGSIEA